MKSQWLMVRVALLLALLFSGAVTQAQVVISQVYGGGGNTNALYTHDFVELFNLGNTPVSVNGWSVQYASSTGTTWQTTPLGNLTIQPGQYLLVQQAAGAGGTEPLPTPDVIGSIAMAAGNGKVALVASTIALTGGCPLPDTVDFVGFGTANCFEGSGATPGLGNNTSAVRADAGCTDTDDNADDFATATPPTPRNSASPLNICGGGGDPVLFISDAQAPEGDAGLSPMDFTVTLTAPAPVGGVDFTATTADGTAEAGVDYVALVDEPFTIDEGETTATVTVQIIGNTEFEPNKTFTVTIATSTPGIVLGNDTATGTILNDDIPTVEIYDIQGTGLRSPFAPPSGNTFGETVTTLNNVVTAIASNGFFMQTPDDRAGDAPAEASTGIFVFTGGAPAVQIGDLVDVTATVQEFFDWTQLTGSPEVTIVGTGPLPEPVALDETRPSPDPDNLSCPLTQTNFECFESMRVSVATGVAVTGNQRFGSDPYAEAYVTASGIRARREKGLLPTVTPPDPSLPVWDGNPEVFELDADGAGAVPNPTAIFGGDLFEAIGVISYQFGNYALRPTEIVLVEAEFGPVAAPEGDAELRVGSFNVLNMCQESCSPRLERVAAYIDEVLLLPDVIGLQEVWTDLGLDQLAAHLNTLHGTDYVGYPGIANTTSGTGIRNAFLVRASRVAVTQVRNLDVDVMITECSGTPPCVLHDRPPQLLEGTFDGQPFAVMNNHTRSFIGINNAPPNGPRVRFKRFEQAKSIARLVQRFQQGLELEGEEPEPTDTADVPLILVGDYNTFEVTDGYVDVIGVIAGSYDNSENEYQLDDDGMGGTVNITDPPLRNLVLEVPLEDRYSYTFAENLGTILGENPRTAGAIQVLDHGLSSVTADPWCPELHYGRGNADAPGEVSQNGTGAIGSSDHDGLVVRLRTDRGGICEPAADLMVVVTAPASPVDVGSVASFTVQVENAGPDAVAVETNTALLIAIDAPAATITLIRDGQDFFDCSDPVPDTAQSAQIFCDLTSTLERDEFETFTVNIAVSAPLSGASLAVAAAVDSEFDDPQPANNSDQAAVDVALAPDAIFSNGFE
ncbi:MAG TPA: lamin tail domain-containing protein [Xanthomonadaceae bacterium]|nr:lamin tail domain-containing protein [Xanthomonadaceae bacterium]